MRVELLDEVNGKKRFVVVDENASLDSCWHNPKEGDFPPDGVVVETLHIPVEELDKPQHCSRSFSVYSNGKWLAPEILKSTLNSEIYSESVVAWREASELELPDFIFHQHNSVMEEVCKLAFPWLD